MVASMLGNTMRSEIAHLVDASCFEMAGVVENPSYLHIVSLFTRFSGVLQSVTALLSVPCSTPKSSQRLSSLSLRFNVEFQWFLIALSVLPGRYREINDHLFPSLYKF